MSQNQVNSSAATLFVKGKLQMIGQRDSSVLTSAHYSKLVNTTKDQYDRMNNDEKQTVLQGLDTYFSAIGSLQEATNQAARRVVLKMRELRIWEALGVEESIFFDNNPRYGELNRIHIETMESRALHLKMIYEAWGQEGLRFVTWQGEHSLESAIDLLDRGEENQVMTSKYLTQLSNLARRVDFETALIVYQLAQIKQERAKVRIRLSEPHISRASVMLSALLKEFNRQGSTHVKVRYTAEDRKINSDLLKDETKKRLAACIQSVGGYTFDIRTWEISFQHSRPRSKIQSQMARIEELRDRPKRSAGNEPDYTESRMRKRKYKSAALITENDEEEEEEEEEEGDVSIAAVTTAAEVSTLDVLTSPPTSPAPTRPSTPSSLISAPASPSSAPAPPTSAPTSSITPNASVTLALSLPLNSPRVLRSQSRQQNQDAQASEPVAVDRTARRRIPVRDATPVMQSPGMSYEPSNNLIDKASKKTEAERQALAWRLVCGAMYLMNGEVENRRSHATIDKIWKLLEDFE